MSGAVQRKEGTTAVGAFNLGMDAKERFKAGARAALKQGGILAQRAFALLLRGLEGLGTAIIAAAVWLWPHVVRLSVPFRRWVQTRFRNLKAKARAHPIWFTATSIVLALVAINGTIQLNGGGPELLSTKHLKNKTVAVVKFLVHLPFHPFGSCDASPEDLIMAAARDHGVPAALVTAVARTESNFRPHAISHAGAMGVMQLMPSTAALMGVSDPYDAASSIRGGARYLGQLYERYGGDIGRTAAAYHAGPGAVAVSGPLRVGPITRRYMAAVSRRTARIVKARPDTALPSPPEAPKGTEGAGSVESKSP